jgi:tetratricopeptide (TPR) repeat protein
MKKLSLFIILFICISLSYAQERNLRLVKNPTDNPTNQKRKAVVIGMSDYGEGRNLNNTLNDASDMAEVLTKLGFEVTLLKNNDLRSLKTNLANWYSSIERNDMAIFYFAGHGMEVRGENYLIPVDAELSSQADVQYNTINVNQVLDNMDEKRIGMKLLILDACRDNPFTRGWSRGSNDKGLAQMRAPKGTLIAFAAAPGATAQDGGTYNLQNGVFTYFLKQEIMKEGASIDNILNRVAGNVSKLTNDKQLPYKSGILTEDFYFIPPVQNLDPAELLNKANILFGNKQYQEALPFYEQAAIAGNIGAQNRLGICYANGFGVVKDINKAVEWYKKAAEQGSDAAQNSLGYYYEYGLGVTKDIDQATDWYKKAAEQGNINAQSALDRLQKMPDPTPIPIPTPEPEPIAINATIDVVKQDSIFEIPTPVNVVKQDSISEIPTLVDIADNNVIASPESGKALNFTFKGLETKNNVPVELYLDNQLIGKTNSNEGFQFKYASTNPGTHELRIVWAKQKWKNKIDTTKQIDFKFEYKKKKTGFGYEHLLELVK